MEKFPKIRFIVITILIITLINVVALALILRHSFNEHRSDRDNDKRSGKGFDYLKEKLQLTPEQETLFKNEKDTFFASANKVFDELEKKRLEMISEFMNSNPDTVILYEIASRMGDDHGHLKRHVVNHLLKLRSYCTPEQVVKLDSMYNFMIRTDSPWRKKNQHTGHNEKGPDERK